MKAAQQKTTQSQKAAVYSCACKQNCTEQNEKHRSSHTDRVVKLGDAGVDQVVAFTPVHLGAASLQLVPKNQINVTHVWTCSVGWTVRSQQSFEMKTLEKKVSLSAR